MFPVPSNERAGSVEVNWKTVSTVRVLAAALTGPETATVETSAMENAIPNTRLKVTFMCCLSFQMFGSCDAITRIDHIACRVA